MCVLAFVWRRVFSIKVTEASKRHDLGESWISSSCILGQWQAGWWRDCGDLKLWHVVLFFTLTLLCSQRVIWVGQVITLVREEEASWRSLPWSRPPVCLHTSRSRGLLTWRDSSTCEKVLLCLGSHLPVVGLSYLVQGPGLNSEVVTLLELGPVPKPQFIHLQKGNLVVLSQGL